MAHRVHIDSILIRAISTGIVIYSTYKAVKLWKNHRQVTDKENVYESKKYLQEYLLFHYGSPRDVLSWDFGPQDAVDFPKRCADVCVKYCNQLQPEVVGKTRALDIGCNVGRHSFELARSFTEVIGIDYSQSFVDACDQLRLEGHMSYSVILEGDLYHDMEVVIDPDIDRSRTQFIKGDACDLDLYTLGQFDCVLASLLICRLHAPRKFLSDMRHLVAPGGVLVIMSPYSFSTDYTPRENWIGAYMKNGVQFTGFDGLQAILLSDFVLVAEDRMPYLIRENSHEYQWSVAHTTVWRKKQHEILAG